MFCPDHNDTVVTQEQAIEHLITCHGKDTTQWPGAVPEPLKADADAMLLSERKEKSLCPSFDTEPFKRRFFRKVSGQPVD